MNNYLFINKNIPLTKGELLDIINGGFDGDDIISYAVSNSNLRFISTDCNNWGLKASEDCGAYDYVFIRCSEQYFNEFISPEVKLFDVSKAVLI